MAAKLELTVSQLNEYVRRMFQMDPMLRAIELKGEISNLKFHQSGALFFTMKDENAAISCVMYADETENLQAMPFEGMRATASGSVALYARGGQYQFVVKRLHAQGVGVLYERLQMLKEKLGREGLFAPERKRALPRYPDTVGVVSSPTGAVIRDILNVSLRRNPNARILLCPVRVQGVEAPAEIAGAIRNGWSTSASSSWRGAAARWRICGLSTRKASFARWRCAKSRSFPQSDMKLT